MDAVLSITLNRDLSEPLYYQLKEQIKALILKGEYKPNDRLPTEEELCDLLSISRPVVRQAYNALIQENLITRRIGSGTFVSELPQKNLFKEYISFSLEKNLDFANNSRILSTQIIQEIELLKKYSFFKEIESQKLYRYNENAYIVDRLIYDFGYPSLLFKTMIIGKNAPGFESYFGQLKDYSEIELFEKYYGSKLAFVRRSLMPEIASEETQKLLNLKENELVYRIESKYYDELNRLVIVRYMICPINQMSFEVEVKNKAV